MSASPGRLAARIAVAAVAGVLPLLLIDDPRMARAVALTAAAVAAWLLELVAAFVPTLLVLAIAPLAVEGVSLRLALGWAADPMIALFFGGFALGTAATATGLDQRMAELMVRAAGGSARRLVVTTTVGGFMTSMWMSGAAAAAVQLTALRPLLGRPGTPLPRALLLAVAMGTNFGGLVTPMGAGPNAIAVAELASRAPVSFVRWMSLALPLAALLTAGAAIAIVAMLGRGPLPPLEPLTPAPLNGRQRALVGVFACAVLGWLTEPLHGVPAPSLALAVAGTLFVTGLLRPRDLAAIDWSTLLLIAGGLVVGHLLEHAHALEALTQAVPLAELPRLPRNLLIIGVAALLSALMSNTATAAVLIPLALAIDPSPTLPILIAMGCGLGVPFTISTPPNAMVVGAGAAPRDLMLIGLPLMVLGVLLVALTGDLVLAWMGIG